VDIIVGGVGGVHSMTCGLGIVQEWIDLRFSSLHTALLNPIISAYVNFDGCHGAAVGSICIAPMCPLTPASLLVCEAQEPYMELLCAGCSNWKYAWSVWCALRQRMMAEASISSSASKGRGGGFHWAACARMCMCMWWRSSAIKGMATIRCLGSSH
jgi:hypothetical protein